MFFYGKKKGENYPGIITKYYTSVNKPSGMILSIVHNIKMWTKREEIIPFFLQILCLKQ